MIINKEEEKMEKKRKISHETLASFSLNFLASHSFSLSKKGFIFYHS